jgi:hypothetical protein
MQQRRLVAGERGAEPLFTPIPRHSPPGLGERRVRPDGASFHKQLGEFLLMYDHVRQAKSPRDEILEFAQSAYETGAELAGWDRASLERK